MLVLSKSESQLAVSFAIFLMMPLMFSSFSLRFAGSQVLITYVFKPNAVHRLLYYEETGIFYNMSNAWGPCSHKMFKINAEEKW